MKKLLIFVTVACLFISACGSVLQEPTSSPLPSHIPKPTQTNSPTVTLTATAVPTRTTTPLPPPPTIVATFDISTLVTVTPAQKENCTAVKSNENPNYDLITNAFIAGSDVAEENALKFLNSFGPKSFIKHLRNSGETEGQSFAYIDLTNDGEPEILVDLYNFYVFGCKNGQFITLMDFLNGSLFNNPWIVSLDDNNGNGIPELALRTLTMSQGGHTYEIYEWNGNEFRTLHTDEIWAEVDGKISFADIDHDQINELILDSGVPVWETYFSGLPWRNERTIYEWDGLYYVPARHEFAPPEFRFQAIQDGDLATNQYEYDKAMQLYEEAIFNNFLKDFSPEIRKNLRENWNAQWD